MGDFYYGDEEDPDMMQEGEGDEEDEDQEQVTQEMFWAVITAYFDEKGLVRQQLDSFEMFVEMSLQEVRCRGNARTAVRPAGLHADGPPGRLAHARFPFSIHHGSPPLPPPYLALPPLCCTQLVDENADVLVVPDNQYQGIEDAEERRQYHINFGQVYLSKPTHQEDLGDTQIT